MSGRLPRADIQKKADECKQNIDRLVELYYETDPEQGEKTEDGKFNKALQALLLVHSASFFTQWAEAHLIGYFNSGNDTPDSHEHEANPEKPDIEAYRAAIATILDKTMPSQAIGYKCPAYHGWREELAESLIAINKGEVFPLLEPKTVKRERYKYTTEKLRSAAVLHVYRLWNEKGTKEEARRYVSGQIGTSPENIDKWEKSILNKEDPERYIRNAVKAGADIARKRNVRLKELKAKLSGTDFAKIWREENQNFNSPEIMHHDILMWDFPLQHLGQWLFRDLKSGT